MQRTTFRWGGTFLSGAYSVALALLFILLLRSIAVQITPPPLPFNEPYPNVSSPDQCEAEGGRWIEATRDGSAPGRPVPATIEEETAIEPGFCQGPLRFERERQLQEEKSRQTSLFVFAIGGTLAVAASVLVRTVRVLPAGFVLGGIMAFFVAGTHLWLLVPGLGRLITIAVLFVFLLGIGWYAFRGADQAATPDNPQT